MALPLGINADGVLSRDTGGKGAEQMAMELEDGYCCLRKALDSYKEQGQRQARGAV